MVCLTLGRGFMMKGIYFIVLSIIMGVTNIHAFELMSVNFKQKKETSELELFFDSNDIQANKFQVTEDKQIIIDLKNVVAKEKVIRGFDTSEFSGSIVYVSAYTKPGSKGDLRIALQLRDNVRSVLKRKPNRLVLEIENRFGAFSQQKINDFATYKEKIADNSTNIKGLNIPKSDKLEDILENLTLSGRKKYIGKRVSINVKNVEIEEILNLLSEASGFNIIITQEITKLAPLTLNLTNVPWDQVLDTILNLNKLVATKNGVILMITTLAKATEDAKIEAEAKKLSVKEEPLVTKVFPISFTETEDLISILKEYSTETRGKLSTDKRTNSIIVKDVAGVIDKMRKIVEVLDTETPQVMIEAKIVEVVESYAKNIGLTNGIGFGYDPVGSRGGETINVGAEITDGADAGPGFSFSSASRSLGTSTAFGFAVARFGRLTDLTFNLQMLESEAKGKIIASPKIITENKKKASISTSDERFFKITETAADGTVANSDFKEVKSELKLDVTPQVSNDGSISLDIELKKEQFAPQPDAQLPPPKQGRVIKTRVLVDNGNTIVIGGIYNYQSSESHSGVPFLKDIPLVGWLFRTPVNPTTDKNELIIFITPRIINQDQAGLVTSSM
jgi:type IV pilus assembly protein PilQ